MHRFTDPRSRPHRTDAPGENPALLLDRLLALGLVVVHRSAEDAHLAIGRAAREGDGVTAPSTAPSGEQAHVVAGADVHLVDVRDEVAAPLIELS